jgi:hypothetical protein
MSLDAMVRIHMITSHALGGFLELSATARDGPRRDAQLSRDVVVGEACCDEACDLGVLSLSRGAQQRFVAPLVARSVVVHGHHLTPSRLLFQLVK